MKQMCWVKAAWVDENLVGSNITIKKVSYIMGHKDAIVGET